MKKAQSRGGFENGEAESIWVKLPQPHPANLDIAYPRHNQKKQVVEINQYEYRCVDVSEKREYVIHESIQMMEPALFWNVK